MGPSSLHLRHASPTDAEVLLQLSLDAILTSARGHYSASQLSAWAARRTVEGHRLMIDRTLVLVAEVDGVAAGFANLATDVGELDQLFVAPWAGGLGAGRLLVQAIEGEAVKAGLLESRLGRPGAPFGSSTGSAGSA